MSSWEEKSLGDISFIIDGDRGINYPKAEDFFDDEYCLFLNTGNVTTNGFDFSNKKFITRQKDELLRKGRVSVGDIVFTTRGTVGNCAFYKKQIFKQLRINSGMVILRCEKYVDNKFLYQYFKTSLAKEYFKMFSSGSAQPQLPIKDMKKIKIKIPDLATQQRIADILSAYDDLIENNNRRIELFEKAAQDLYKEWFVRFRFPGYENAKFKDGLPEGWEVKKIIEIADAVGGGTPSTSEKKYWDNGDIMWVTPTDITKNKNLVLIDVEKRITKLGLKNSSAKMLPPYTILMTSRASIGFFGIINKSVCTNQGFISLINKNSNYRYYTLFALINQRDVIESRATGATFKEISKSSFKEMKILVPHINVVYDYNKFTDDIFNKILELKTKNQNLKKQRDLLMPRLMSGKLEV